MIIKSFSDEVFKINSSIDIQKTFYPKFKGKFSSSTPSKVMSCDIFEKDLTRLKTKLLEIRTSYLRRNPEAFITLDHMKSNYNNHFIIKSVIEQTKALQAVSTEDFCNLSEIMKNIRLPEAITVYRAMEARDFNIGRLTPEEFFNEYFSEGKKVVVPVYMLSSLDKNIAFRFASNKPYRFIIKLDVPQNHPAVYMEELAPNDGEVFDNEEEVSIIRNSEVILKNVKKIKNPLDNKEIYQVEGEVIGFRDVIPKQKEEIAIDDDMLELLEAIGREEMF